MVATYIGMASGVHRLTKGGVAPLDPPSERISAVHARREDGGSAVLQPIADH
ncbi:MAG TPA: hypothetical protein VMW65_05690 [Chloroflexota bacterium]|nr:hypothetical protein [Chloroflexota bacterium]